MDDREHLSIGSHHVPSVLLEGDARNTLGAGVSIEPPGGSAQPSKDVVALVEF